MLTVRPLLTLTQTAQEMVRLARAYKEDMAPYASFSVQELFDFLKAIPYRADPKGLEYLQRPYYTVNQLGAGGDCDDKAICVAAWALCQGKPFRYVAVSRKKDKPLHHVFAEVKIGTEWVGVDPTYSHHVLNQRPPYARREVIGGAA